MKPSDIDQIEKILGIKFSDRSLIEQAFTHKSKSMSISKNNERLEFLGDRVLGLVIAGFLSNEYPKDAEGVLDKKLASLVNKETCSKIISSLKIDQFLSLSKAQKQNKAGNRKILGDLCESIIGAVFLDKGFEHARKFVLKIWKDNLKNTLNVIIDPKTKLQEYSLKLYKKLPIYKYISNSGPSHKPNFKVSVSIEKSKSFSAIGSSKKIAETNAAKKLIEYLNIK
ncbi:MAG: ribonuclease III [Pelagibacteraceae bacterium]|nr:ribonuclease III [Pelagibacteraceae bacterium]|tara:strand:- start:1685 stop:2362 length:678 start_codon:yes stop_codon:yes gene_type:complete